MATANLYRQRAKEGREKAEAAHDETSRRTWLEIASGFEHLADQPGKTPWHIECVERKK
jgi:hypothetical protein